MESHLVTIQFKWNRQVTKLTVHTIGIHYLSTVYTVGHITHACMHTHTYTHSHIHTHTYTLTHPHTHTYTLTHPHTHMHTYSHIHTHAGEASGQHIHWDKPRV